MYINDQITKMDSQAESLLRKIERQYQDIDEEAAQTPFKVKTRDGNNSLETYLQEFQWDDSKFARNQQMQLLIKELQNRMFRVENELKSKTQQLQENKSLQNQNAGKEGSLVSRDLTEVLKEPMVNSKDFVNTRYVQTLVVIVPKQHISIFMQNYELVSENVIAGSLIVYPYLDKDGAQIMTVKLLKINVGRNNLENPFDTFAQHVRD